MILRGKDHLAALIAFAEQRSFRLRLSDIVRDLLHDAAGKKNLQGPLDLLTAAV